MTTEIVTTVTAEDIKDAFEGEQLEVIASLIHQINVEHGFWEKDRNFGEVIALIHSELSEALEENRSGKPLVYFENEKPEGAAIELIDAAIRIFDFVDAALVGSGYSISELFQIKTLYNNSRPHKHGRAY